MARTPSAPAPRISNEGLAVEVLVVEVLKVMEPQAS
jgi:hypothetical protein